MKTCYTAIFGNYDDLKEPAVVTPGWKYVCFTDQMLASNHWEIVQRPMLPEGPQRTARFYKLMFHRHILTQYSLWVDASFQINVDLDNWWQQFQSPMTCVKHPIRNDVYEELEACHRFKKDATRLLNIQAEVYRKIGIPENNGLIASGILMREMTPAVINLCDIWYQQIVQYSARDQVAFAFASYQLPIHNLISWDYRFRREFIHIPHLHKRKRR